jgi:hypothetical protein
MIPADRHRRTGAADLRAWGFSAAILLGAQMALFWRVPVAGHCR